MQTLQETIRQYSVRLKSLEDFISLQFGEAYEQFRIQTSDEIYYGHSGAENSYDSNSQDDMNEIGQTKIKQENLTFLPKLIPASHRVPSHSYSISSIATRKTEESSRSCRILINTPVLEGTFVSDSIPEADPLEVEVEKNYWDEEEEDNQFPVAVEYGDDNDTNDSQIYEVYDDEEVEDDEIKITQIAGTSIVCTPSSSTDINITSNQMKFKARNHSDPKVTKPNETTTITYAQLMSQKRLGHECPFCENQYETRTVVFQHILDDHTGGQSYCPICQKSYALQKDFRCHLQRHDKRNRIRFKCSYCAKYFGSRKELNNHERIHTGEKPYCCTTCHKVFRTSSSLIRHQKCHGRNVCKYPHCKLRFIHYKDLFKHQASANHFLK